MPSVKFRRAMEAADRIADASPPWDDILTTARDLIGADSGSLIMMDGAGQLLNITHVDMSGQALDEYVRHFHKVDFMAEAASRLAAGAWIDSNDVMPLLKSRQAEFHADYMRKHGQAQSLALILERDSERRTGLTFQRSTVAANATDRLTEGEAGAYVRHFRKVLSTRRRAMANKVQLLEDSFAALGEATCLLSASGLVLHASALAHELLDNRQGLCIRQGRLYHAEPAVLARLLGKLQDALRTGQRMAATVALDWGKTLGIDMVPADAQVKLSDEPLALVRLRVSSAFNEVSIDDLICTFKITAAEARVLAALMAGHTPAQFAAQNGLSENTVRTHITNLKGKMNCRRVVELVKLATLVQR
ncbi:hypothetical protein LMG31506_02145 [Cupriavidus yeoncheonensis]|uniref:HTH luxR-type domain-containing protein n=1 Tax=Cupriavidus yeoncheonensis TaxID=1462994 RepID=A0A916MXE7_9BURK|nr:helix-turn-helix transcriptional regulator [Cupriavidus yeoncheonensis]CAG2139641.1 hypothetical protein LMG31506_02145 [Cupriavidus yeoncheonensis]